MKSVPLMLSALVFSPLLHAQFPDGQSIHSNTQLSEHSVITSAVLGAVTGKPYSAQRVSRSVWHLSDGTTISTESHGMLARSGTGMMREDMVTTQSGSVGTRDVEHTFTMTTVADPIAHTVTMWHEDPKSKLKTAMVMDMPNVSGLMKNPLGKNSMAGMLSAGTPPPLPGGIAGGNGVKPIKLGTTQGLGSVSSDTHTEELGQQSMEGLLVTGKRTTTVIPLGKIGNDRPITVVHEVWTSPDLGIVVKQIDSDPRTGEQTLELTDISRGDPDATLFHPPADYKIQNFTEMMKKLGNLGKAPEAQH